MSKRKWNRTHYFMNKASKNLRDHPVYVYGRSGKSRKYLMFTHDPGLRQGYTKLKHNVDPEDNDDCYVNNRFKISHETSLKDPKKKYRIHKDDMETIKKYMK